MDCALLPDSKRVWRVWLWCLRPPDLESTLIFLRCFQGQGIVGIMAQRVVPFWNQEAACGSLMEGKKWIFASKKFFFLLHCNSQIRVCSGLILLVWFGLVQLVYLIFKGSGNEGVVAHIRIVETCHYPHPLTLVMSLSYNHCQFPI